MHTKLRLELIRARYKDEYRKYYKTIEEVEAYCRGWDAPASLSRDAAAGSSRPSAPRRGALPASNDTRLPSAHRTPAGCSVYDLYDDFNPVAFDDHGRGTMLLDPPGHVHDALAHHDPDDGRLLPSSAPPPADMAGAPTAPALAALAAVDGEGAPAAPVVSAPAPAALAGPIDFAQLAHANTMDTSMGMAMDMDAAVARPQTDINAFARLRFSDGSYYVNTFQVIIGRNVRLAQRDARRLAKIRQLRASGQEQAADRLHSRVHSTPNKKQKRHNRGARSVASEKGGIVSAPIAAMPAEFQQRRQSNAEPSLSSASHHTGESSDEPRAARAPQEVIMQAFSEAPTYMDGHVPEDPNECPLVPIHPSHLEIGQRPNSISRIHARIFYDFDKEQFHIEVLGHNGVNHEKEFYRQGEVIPLEHGDEIIIGGVVIHFYLPDTTLTDDQRQRRKSTSRPISYSFEDGNGDPMVEPDSDEQMGLESDGDGSMNPRHMYYFNESEPESEDAVEDDDDLDAYEEPAPRPRQKHSVKLTIKAPPPPLPAKEAKRVPKRKQREVTPEEPLPKRAKQKSRESAKEPTRDAKAVKEPKEAKEKGKVPSKGPAKTPPSQKTTEDTKTEPAQEAVEKSKPVPNDAPILLRYPKEGEVEAGNVEGLITEEVVMQYKLPPVLIGQVMEKRKGPGRPPKDGIMSKRQRSLLVKQGKEIEKAKAAGIDPADIPAPAIKPKAPKRKESNAADGDDDDIMESTERGDGTVSNDKKQVKPVKPPRTPSPEMRLEDYTEEQLQRPSSNYVVLIHEAISSSRTGQMNLQQIYNFIEKKYPFYKFKVNTSGWQSSVRHNLGQHDAFVKGDKEGKGFNWRVNPEVSIEKERRKRQVSPPGNAQRPPYYPAPNGYVQYPQPGYPYHAGMPHGMSSAVPRLPPSLQHPRLPPSMARDTNATASTTPQSAAPHASPYASPWAGGNTAGSPTAPNPPGPYPPSSETPRTGSAGSNGPHPYTTSAPQAQNGLPTASPYSGQQYGAAGSPYTVAPGQQPYPPYPPTQASLISHPPAPAQGHTPSERAPSHPSGRYPLATHPDLIRQLETFRNHYLSKRPEPGEDKKVDNVIRACVDTTVPIASLTLGERNLLEYVRKVEGITKHLEVKQDIASSNTPVKTPLEAGMAAVIAAGAAKSTGDGQMRTDSAAGSMPPSQTAQPGHEPHKFAPDMTGAPAYPSSSTAVSPSHRPSVEPLTPLPGSPATQNGMSRKGSTLDGCVDSPKDVGELKEVTKAQGNAVNKVDDDDEVKNDGTNDEKSVMG